VASQVVLCVILAGPHPERHITPNATEEIELNFRDEKTLLGFGQPQVRSDPAVRTTATFFVFVSPFFVAVRSALCSNTF
jgi:hypothetical protein